MMSAAKEFPNSWDGVKAAAAAAGSKWPELVASQWALESGWGKHTPNGAPHNYFGLKGDNATASETKEFVNGQWITIQAEFIDFPDLYSCVDYLVSRWYKDFKGYKGVNSCPTIEKAAQELQRQGYATDPGYPAKLLKVREGQQAKKGPKKSHEDPILFRLWAKQDTWLKKEPVEAGKLQDGDKLAVANGRNFSVLSYNEKAADSHAQVKLAFGAGTWWIYEPHWSKAQGTGEALVAAVDWSDFNCLVTPNLTVGEVLQFDRRRTPKAGSSACKQLLKTAAQFQRLRDAWARPLGVTSFYRPEPINSQVGGVQGSRHVTGEAFDIYPADRSIDAFYQWVRVRWTGGLGDGRNRGFIHLDTRGGGGFAPAAGARPSAEWLY
jgi:hypothetical protein